MGHVYLRGESQNNVDLVACFLMSSRCQPLPYPALCFIRTVCLRALHSPGTSRCSKSSVLWKENRFGKKPGKLGFLRKTLATGTKNWLQENQENGQRAPGWRSPVQELKTQMLGNLSKQKLAGRSERRSFHAWSFLTGYKNKQTNKKPPATTKKPKP